MSEIRFSAGTAELDGNTVKGTAVVYGTPTRGPMEDGYVHMLKAGSLDEALKNVRLFVRYQHQRNTMLASTKAGTLRLNAQPDRLDYEFDMPDTSLGRDLKTLMTRGDLNEVSIGITQGKFALGKLPDKTALKEHTEVKSIFDLSLVDEGAFPNTSAQLHELTKGESLASKLARARERAYKELMG